MDKRMKLKKLTGYIIRSNSTSNPCTLSALLMYISPMAFSTTFKHRFALMVLLCMAAITRCISQINPGGIINRALACFNDQSVYTRCQEDYRLHAEGIFHVPQEAADDYCGGPCLSETKLVLKCVDNIMHSFRFYNGATLEDIGRTLATGCSHTKRRGDFGFFEGLGAEGYGDYYDHGNKLAIPTSLLIILSGVLILWG